MMSDDARGGTHGRTLLAGWRAILLALSAAAGAFAALAGGVLAPPRYAATARIADPVGPRVERDLRVLTSPAVLSRVVHAARLDQDRAFGSDPSPTARIGAGVKSVLAGWKPPVEAADDAATRSLARAVTVARDGDVIALTVTAPEPDQAARLADTVAATFLTDFQPAPATARVVAPAPRPARRTWPPRPGALAAAGLILGLLAGAFETMALGRLAGFRTRPAPGSARS